MTKILIIEDDPVISRMYSKVFLLDKYEVIIAENGEAGLNLAKSDKPNLILLDIMMPNMNGMEVLDRLQADVNTKLIPVIIMTNLASEKNAEIALAKGVARYIIKSSVEPQQLLDIVKEVLTKG